MKSIAILGTRGIPANHGGFETFVESLAPFLASQNLRVRVYCQKNSLLSTASVSEWQGVQLVSIQPQFKGALGTADFDFKSIMHVLKNPPDLVLVFGYNTALFCLLLKIKKIPFAMNMDGLEWKRKKWNLLFKIWFWLNEKAGGWLSNHLIADHPEIQKHLERFAARSKISMIPYGADVIKQANENLIHQFRELKSGCYGIFIGRPEPENHVLEIVRAFSQKKRNMHLVILGDYSSLPTAYQKQVTDCASQEVLFPGAIYDLEVVNALLYYSGFYCHGHSVGGTNPSLIQAMAAGCRVIAHDNIFNRGILKDQAVYFISETELAALLDDWVPLSPERRVEYPQLSSTREINERYLSLIHSLGI